MNMVEKRVPFASVFLFFPYKFQHSVDIPKKLQYHIN